MVVRGGEEKRKEKCSLSLPVQEKLRAPSRHEKAGGRRTDFAQGRRGEKVSGQTGYDSFCQKNACPTNAKKNASQQSVPVIAVGEEKKRKRKT